MDKSAETVDQALDSTIAPVPAESPAPSPAPAPEVPAAPPAPEAPAPEKPAETPAEPAKAADAAELESQLGEYGITKEQIPELLQQARAFQHSGQLMQSNPDEYLRTILRFDPVLYDRLVAAAAEHYIERQPEGTKLGDRPTPSASEVRELGQRLSRIEGAINQGVQQQAYSKLQTEYEAKTTKLVDDLKLPVRDTIAVRAMLDRSIATDQATRARIHQGDFRDIPKHLQGVLKQWAGDTKATTDAEADKRAAVQAKAGKQPAAGAVAQGTDVWDDTTGTGKPGGPVDFWDEGEKEFAEGLKGLKK